MVSLLFAEMVLYLMVLLQQAVDTSVWIALIAGVVGLLTLIIQTYGQIQLAGIKVKQEAQTVAIKIATDKVDAQGEKLEVVHNLTNSTNTKQQMQIEEQNRQIAELTRAIAERARTDAAVMMDRATQRQLPPAAAAPPALAQVGAAAAQPEPVKVEVINPEPLPVDVVVKPEKPPADESKL